MKKLLALIVIVFLSVPVAPILAFLLMPFWRWLEEETGLESLGHSGPADWCVFAVYILLVAAGFTGWLRYRPKNVPKPVKAEN
jgi:hypothetical protein